MIRRSAPVLAVLAASALALAGCGGDPEPVPPAAAASTTPDPTPPPSPAAEPTTEAPEPAAPKLGDKQTTELGTATVYAVKFPVRADDETARDIADKGTQFAVADIKVCANGEVDEDGYGFDAGNFQLVDTQSRAYEYWNVQVGARSPNLTDSVSGVDTPRKGSCKRGWLTFQLPPKAKIASVEYVSSGTPLTWQVKK
jgi:hypothetical protein